PALWRVSSGPCCAPSGEWVVAVTCCMVDVDRPLRRLAFGPLNARIIGWRRSRGGGVHLYIDAPPSEAMRWARAFRGDETHAAYSTDRGGWGDGGETRRVPRRVPAARRAWWRALVQAHTVGMGWGT